MSREIKYEHPKYGTVYAEGSFEVPKLAGFPRMIATCEEMKTLQARYLGANRIHKPMRLLFWSDCMNGKGKANWPKEII